MTEIVLSLEVVNQPDHPREAELLSQELAHMTTRIEEEPDYTEEDELLVHGFAGEYHTYDGPSQLLWVRETVAKLSKDFPELVFALDVKDDTDYLRGGPAQHLRREYFHDGGRQVVEPYLVIPDFDPHGELE